MRIVFMGTPEFSLPVLQALVEEETYEVVAVYSQPPRPKGRGQHAEPTPIARLAAQYDIPIYTPERLTTAEVQAEFRSLQADVAVVMAYGLLLPKAILETPTFGCINVHPSTLPKFRGASPMQYTILSGDKTTSLMVIQMDEGLDSGDILASETINIPVDITLSALHDMMADKAPSMVLSVLENCQSGNLQPIKQSSEGVIYANKIRKDQGKIDWLNQTAEEIECMIRALSPYPGVFFSLNGERIKILQAEVVDREGEPGVTLDNQLTIACKNKALKVKQLQRQGKKVIGVNDFLRGYPIAIKTDLGQ